jgi:hypothetical protein
MDIHDKIIRGMCEEYIYTANMAEDIICVYKNNLLLGELDEDVYQK